MNTAPLLAVLLAATLVTLPTPAFAEPTPTPTQSEQATAVTLVNEGRLLFDKGRFAEACSKFEASRQIDPQPATLRILTRCYEKLGKAAPAPAPAPASASAPAPASASAPASTPAPAPASASAPDFIPYWSSQRITGLTLASLGITGLVVGTIFGLRASDMAREAAANCIAGTPIRCTAEGITLRNDATNAALVSDIGLLGGAGLTFGGALLFFFAPKSKTIEQPVKHASFQYLIVPTIGFNQAGLLFAGNL